MVRGLNLEVILGNDFLIRHSAVIDFKKRIVELSHESQPIRVSFERVSDAVRVSGLRVIQNWSSDKRMEVRVNACRERENDEREEQIWEKRAHKFCSEGGVIGSPQRRALWRVVESFKEVFAELPGRARNYECELKVRAVSYTHLDVYKRQDLSKTESRISSRT